MVVFIKCMVKYDFVLQLLVKIEISPF